MEERGERIGERRGEKGKGEERGGKRLRRSCVKRSARFQAQRGTLQKHTWRYTILCLCMILYEVVPKSIALYANVKISFWHPKLYQALQFLPLRSTTSIPAPKRWKFPLQDRSSFLLFLPGKDTAL